MSSSDHILGVQPQLKYQQLLTERIDDVATLLANVFIDHPSFSAIFNLNHEDRFISLQYLFKKNIELLHNRWPHTCHCYVDEVSNELLAFCMAVPNGEGKISMIDMIFGGILYLTFLSGINSVLKMLRFMDVMKNTENEVLKEYFAKLKNTSPQYIDLSKESFFKMYRVAVNSKYHRRGIGSKLLRHVFDITGAGKVPTFLDTQLPQNVDFYQKLGFHVVLEELVQPDESRLAHKSWYLARDPN